jgi:hypothetical protein
VELTSSTSSGLAAGVPRGVLSAQIEAWQGNYQEAARLFVQEGQVDKVSTLHQIEWVLGAKWVLRSGMALSMLLPMLCVSCCGGSYSGSTQEVVREW